MFKLNIMADSIFDAQRDRRIQNLQQQTNSRLQEFIAAKKSEANKECEALRASMESELKSKQDSKIKQLVERATDKEKTQVDEFNKKVIYFSENTSLIEKLKEVVTNSGDAEAVINKELNVFLQGVASDFGVDGVDL